MILEGALLVIAGASAVAKSFEDYNSADVRRDALNLQAKQMRIAYQQKTLANYDQVQKVLDAQQVAMTIKGVSFNSPSYLAIARETQNIGQKEEKNIKLEQSISERNTQLEKSNVRDTLFAQLFGNVTTTALAGYNAYKAAPKTTGA